MGGLVTRCPLDREEEAEKERERERVLKPPICILVFIIYHPCGPDKCFLSFSFPVGDQMRCFRGLLDEQRV